MASHVGSHNTEGSYLEALSDLFVGFLFIFIIFLMLFALLLTEAKRKTEAVTSQLTNAGELRAQMLEEIQKALRHRGIEIAIDTRTGIARLPESLLFDSGNAQLRPGAGERLRVVSQELQAILPCYAYGVKLQRTCPSNARPILDAMFIEGHTDNVPIHTDVYADNYDLSAQRAKHIFEALLQDSQSLPRLRNQDSQRLLSLSAYGDTRPIRANTTADGRRQNRRIDLRFIVGTPRVDDVTHASRTGRLSL